jgi:Family of unknown function (DUF6502)
MPRLEPSARDAVQRFVRVLARSGCEPQAIKAEVLKTCREIPKSWSNAADRRRADDAAHVMTLWFSDPAFVDARGVPRSLPVRGANLSIESLVRHVDPRLDVRQVLRFLQSGGALKRVGARYVPRKRVLILPGADYMTLILGGLFGLLRTLEHNRWGDRKTERRLQVYSFNPRVPVSAVAGFEKRLRPLAERLLVQADADMHLREVDRKKGERTVRMGVGVYQFLEGPPVAGSPRRSFRSEGKSGSRSRKRAQIRRKVRRGK